MLVIAHYNYEAALFVVVCSPRVGAAPLNPHGSRPKIHSTMERLSEEGKSLREEKERLRNDILGLTTQKEEIGNEAESLADVVQAARSDLFHLNAQKIAVSGEILNLNQERDKAQREAEEAKAQKRAAKAEAAKGLFIFGRQNEY